MVRDSGTVEAQQAAAIILDHFQTISDTWKTLTHFDPQHPGSDVVANLIDMTIAAFADSLRGGDINCAPISRYWISLKPTREMVASATVAMSLFVEALRQSCQRIGDCPMSADDMVAEATSFIQTVTTAILESADLRPGSAAWAEISHELEQQRQRRIAQLSVLTEIAHAVNTTDNIDDLFEQVRTHCSRVINTDNFMISLYDAAADAVVPRLAYHEGVRRRDLEGASRSGGLATVVARIQQPMAVTDYRAECARWGVAGDPLVTGSEQLSYLAAPMIQGGQTIGTIALFCPFTPFDPEEVELLNAVARQTAVALENSRLIEAERRRASQLKAVNQVARRIASLHDVDDLLHTATDLIHELFGYNLVVVFLADPSTEELVLRAHSPRLSGDALDDLRVPPGARSIVADVASSGTPALVGDVSLDPRYFSTPATASTRSELAVPIKRADRVLGVLDVQSPDGFAFDDHDLTTLVTISDQISIALENARLLDDERERARALSLMLATTRAAGSSLVLDEVLERLATGIADAAGGSNCTVYVLDEDGTDFLPAVSIAHDPAALEGSNLSSIVVPINKTPLLNRMLLDQQPVVCCNGGVCRAEEQQLADAIGTIPTLLVPLVAKGRVLGMALISGNEGEQEFSRERIRLIQGVADSAALAIENATLYAKSQGLAIAEERGRLAQEIHDGLAQGLTGISLQLDLADAYLPKKPEQAAEKVRRALELTRINLEEARRSVLDLRAARLQEMPLPDALRQLTQRFEDNGGVRTEFRAEGLPGRLSARVEMGLYRVAEEALDNIRRHSGAERVRVTLKADANQVILTIEDDGVGFDPDIAGHGSRPGAGFGLVGIRERARLLKGSFHLESAQGQGTKLVVAVPYEARLSHHQEPGG